MINIEDIIPFMRKGWVAMDENGEWRYYSEMPNAMCGAWLKPSLSCRCRRLDCFNIAPADDWTKSLIKVGGK